jgi:hypothetical protein
MTVRTNTRTVTFSRPFLLRGYEALLPAGRYEVETDEELFEGVSFPAYRRIMTLIHLHPASDNPGVRQTLKVDPADLDAALKMDRIDASALARSDVSLMRAAPADLRIDKAEDQRALDCGEDDGMSGETVQQP